ncbi:MAG: TonB-dependent receptor [Deltaproteobacteria bacterium]|nr:TonB-dependent receptor [Deltaproteobacteria bacterium]
MPPYTARGGKLHDEATIKQGHAPPYTAIGGKLHDEATMQQGYVMPRLSLLLGICLFSLLLPSPSSFAQSESSNAADSGLDAIVVTAGRREETLREVTGNITVLDSVTIERSTANDLGELMRQQGFQTYSAGAGGTSSLIYIRGIGDSSMASDATNYSTLILINGHRTANVDVSLIGLANVDRIEIIRGPAAVQYGTAALGGVINILTKRGDGPITGSLEIGTGTLLSNKEQFSLSGSNSGFDFAIGGVSSHQGDYRTGSGAIWKNTSVRRRSGLDADFGYGFQDNHRIAVHFNYNLMNDGYAPTSGMVNPNLTLRDFNIYDSYNYTATLSYVGATPDNSLSWALNYTKGRTERKAQYFADYNWPAFSTGFTAIDLEQIQAQITYDDLGLLSFTTGVDFSTHDPFSYSSWNAGPTVSSFKNYGVYALGKLRLFDNSLIVSFGGREDKFTMNSDIATHASTKFTPAFGIAYSPVDFLKIRANYAEGYSVPNSDQWLGNGDNFLPSPELKPQETETIEFGVDVAWNYIDASVTYFTTDYTNKFVEIDTGIPSPYSPYTYFRYSNIGKAKIAGFEFNFRADIGEALDGDYSLAPYVTMTWLTRRENKDPSAPFHPQHPDVLRNIPKFVFTYGVNFDYPEIHLATSINARYFGSNYAENYDTGLPWGSNIWETGGGFTVVDLSVSKRIWDFQDKGHLTLKLDVSNLLDHDYAYSLNYPMPGRAAQVGLAYDF